MYTVSLIYLERGPCLEKNIVIILKNMEYVQVKFPLLEKIEHFDNYWYLDLSSSYKIICMRSRE